MGDVAGRGEGMTILPPPPRPRPRHECKPLDNPYEITRPFSASGTLWECPDCGRWWKYHVFHVFNPEWYSVQWYDIPARRRIAAHEEQQRSIKNGYENRAVKPIHWWDCHPNPNRGRP